MRWRRAVGSVCGVVLAGAVSWAAVCPLCLQEIPAGEKYCSQHKAEILAKTISSTDEKNLVEEVTRARADYRTRLEALEKFYESRGNAERLSQVRKELTDHVEARRFEYVKWEERLPELSATTSDPEAARLLQSADSLRKNVNPFTRSARLKDAAAKYQEILIKHPSSTAVDSAAFGLGEIYSNGAVGEYARAVRFYELAYLSNAKTEHDALFRAAQVCDSDLSEYEDAARFYWMAAKMGKSVLTRERAALRLKQLQKKEFGKSYILEDKPAETPAAPAPAAADKP